ANQRSQPLAGWRVPVDRPGPGSGRHIYGEHPHKPALGIEDLNAPVRSIADVDVVVAIDGNRVRRSKLSLSRTVLAPRFHPVAVPVVLRHARVDVSVADVDVALCIPGDVG